MTAEVPVLFRAMAWIHPTNLEKTDGEICNIPVALVPSGGENSEVMDAIWESLKKKEFGKKCVRKDFVSCTTLSVKDIANKYSLTANTVLRLRGRIGMTQFQGRRFWRCIKFLRNSSRPIYNRSIR